MSTTQNIIDALKNQGIKADSAQLELINRLSKINLNKRLVDVINKFSGNENLGIYIWGDVGRGKTLIINEYIKQLKQNSIKAFHYIDFMNFIHDELNNYSGLSNPLKYVSKTLSKKCNLIFIDEFQVEDVADAMIIANLLKEILNSGVKVILTSNAHPNDLYKDGLQRQKFIKSMQECVEKLDIFMLDGGIDYRTRNIIELDKNKKNNYSDKEITKFLKNNFAFSDDQKTEIQINNRKFQCKISTNNFLWIDFMSFFKEATGTKDYKEISIRYDWIFISNFCECDDDSADIIRRFISFVDIVYSSKSKVKFFFNGVHTNTIYKGTKLDFLWVRCVSRLSEMQMFEYLTKDNN